MPRNIRAVSFDADNCLFNQWYLPTSKEVLSGGCTQVLTHNKVLLDKLKLEAAAFDKTVVLVGSLRQSHEVDILNAVNGTTESIFTAIRAVATELKATLDKFLLVDIYTNQSNGSSFDDAEKKFIERAPQEFSALNIKKLLKDKGKCPADESKLSLLYAQIHKLALDYPEDNITFDFYDDRHDILAPLVKYFEQHSDLLPKNVTLRLHEYEGCEDECLASIQGTGFIDKNYKKTTQDIGLVSRRGESYFSLITPEFLSSRAPFHVLQNYLGLFFYQDVLELSGVDDDETNRLLDSPPPLVY